jgi:FKBP-type peptidyl-prolyl cis-trans isomerase
MLSALVSILSRPQDRSHQDPNQKPTTGILRKPEKCKGKVAKGTEVTINYRAYRWDDEHPFDSTYDESRTPIKFKQGDKSVIPGM